jgi:DNA primase
MSSGRNFGLNVVGSSGGQELVLCPWHHDTRPSAWFNPISELYYCAVCNLGLNAYQLAKRMGFEVEEIEFGEREQEPEDYDLVEEVFDSATMLGSSVTSGYLLSRGVDENVGGYYGVRYQTTEQAVVFPITTIMGKAVGACWRYEHPEKHGTRYKKFGEQKPVWPMHHLRQFVEDDWVIVCEGAFSAMRLQTYLVDKIGMDMEDSPVVALLGAKANREIVDVVAPFQCIFLYDKDRAGINACKRMRAMAPLQQAYTLPKAPDDMDDKELHQLWTKLLSKYDERSET